MATFIRLSITLVVGASVLLAPSGFVHHAVALSPMAGYYSIAPFTGNNTSTATKVIQEACTHVASSGQPRLNQFSGIAHLHVRGAGDTTPCPNRAERVAEMLAGITYATPIFSLPGGYYNITIVWNLSWTSSLTANATTGTGAQCHPCIALANYSIGEGDLLESVTSNGTSLTCLGGGGVTSGCVSPWAAYHQVRSDGLRNRSYSQSHLLLVTVHFPRTYLATGTNYRIATGIGVDIFLLVRGAGSYSTADVDLSAGAGFAQLVSIRVV